MTSLKIIKETDDFVAVNKPCGLISHQSVDLKREDATRLLKKQMNLESLYLLHRLDKDTSGLLLYSKTNSPLHQKLFSNRLVEKFYYLITDRKIKKKEWTVSNHLKYERINKYDLARPTRSGGVKAETHFRLVDQQNGLSLVKAQLLTGRKHQLRAHMLSIDAPILGDVLYQGSQSQRLYLHCCELNWQERNEKINLTCQPEGWFNFY